MTCMQFICIPNCKESLYVWVAKECCYCRALLVYCADSLVLPDHGPPCVQI